MRGDLKVDLEERDYARAPLAETELTSLFGDSDPCEFLNPKSPAYKAMGLKDQKLSERDAIRLMVREPNLIKRPLTIKGRTIIAGFDRDRMREVLAK